MARADCPANVSSSSTCGAERARAPTPDHQDAQDPVAAQDRNRKHRSPAVAEQGIQMGVERVAGQVRHLECPVGGRGPTNQRRFAVNRDGPQFFQ